MNTDAWLESIAQILQAGSPVAPLLALLAGVIVSFSPCSLSSIPLIVGYMQASGERTTSRAFKISLLFALGSAVTFTALGVAAGVLGKIMSGSTSLWYLVLGILMILMALQTWEIIQIIPSSYLTSKNKARGYIGAFIAGILAGVFSSPCSTPVLVVLLALVASSGNVLWGGLLLLFYAIGHGALAVFAGTSVSLAQRLGQNASYGKATKIINGVLGALILALGLYMLYLAF